MESTGVYWIPLMQILENSRLCGYLETSENLSVAEKKGTKMAPKWSPAQRAVWSEPFPPLRDPCLQFAYGYPGSANRAAMCIPYRELNRGGSARLSLLKAIP